MRIAEWIHVITFCFFLTLGLTRSLPRERLRRVVVLGVAGLAVTLWGAWVLPTWVSPQAAEVTRDWLPSALMLVVYQQAGAFFVRIDREFQSALLRIDARYAAPLLRWLARSAAGKILVTWFELAYLLCYAMIPFSMGALYALRLSRHAEFFWDVVLISTYSCYGMLPFLQTLPPRVLGESWLPELPPGAVHRFNIWILQRGSIHANTFPSAHAAASVAAALVLAAVSPVWVGVVFGTVAWGITCGTFVGRYHYLSDAVLGFAVAAVVFVGYVSIR